MENNKFYVKHLELVKEVEKLKNEKKEISDKINQEFDSIKNFLKEEFPETTISLDYYSIAIYNKKCECEFSIVDNTLRMKHYPMSMFGWRPFMMGGMDSQENVIYEGGVMPESEKNKNIDIFPILKEDLINKGKISTAIKTFLSKEKELKDMDKLSNELYQKIYDLGNKININSTAFSKSFIDDMGKMFKDNVTINKVDGLILYEKDVVSLTFKKETDTHYEFLLKFADNKKRTKKEAKKNFYIGNYIRLQNN